MAGLTAALSLFRAGRPVRLYEATGKVGGRLKSRVTSQGFVLDEGFQVLLDAYPAPKRWVDFSAAEAAASHCVDQPRPA